MQPNNAIYKEYDNSISTVLNVKLDRSKFEGKILDYGKENETFIRLKNCLPHGDAVVTYGEIKNQNKCPRCQATYQPNKEIFVDWRWIALTRFHPETEFLQSSPAISKEKYFNPLIKSDDLVQYLMERSHSSNNLSERMKKDKRYNSGKSWDQIAFQALCIKDQTKITIPVRHKDCQHADCYDLSSIVYFVSVSQDRDWFPCEHLDCKAKFFPKQDLKSQLVLDKELLEIIRGGPVFTNKFFLKSDGKFIDEFTKNGSQDTYLNEFYSTKFGNLDKQLRQELQNEALKTLKTIMASPFDERKKDLQNSLNQVLYTNN